MVSLTETTTIPLPAAEVWPLLSDPALVASCIPGATMSRRPGRRRYGAARSASSSARPSRCSAARRSSPTTTRRGAARSKAAASTAAAPRARRRPASSRSRGERDDRACHRGQLHRHGSARNLRQCRRRACRARAARGVLRQHRQAGGRAATRGACRRRAASSGAATPAPATTPPAPSPPRRAQRRSACCGGHSCRGCAAHRQEGRHRDEQAPGIRHPGAGLRRRGRRHAVHPDGRRQHVLVGLDGRQSEASG